VPDSTISRRLRRSGWIAVALLLLLTALAAIPFILTTRLANLALARFLPDNRARAGSARLSLTGRLILRDFVIHDSGVRAQQPLATAREIDAGFGWRELFARRLGWIRANDVTLYARTDGHAQLSLIDFAYEFLRPSKVARTSPFWIGTIEIDGRIRQEGLIPISAAKADLPVALQMMMSGGRAAPSRHFTVVIGGPRQGREQDSVRASTGVNQALVASRSAFEMVADLETQAMAGGTRVMIHRMAAAHAALALDADMLRHFVAALPPELHGRIEVGLANISGSGAVDLANPANRGPFSGGIAFSGFNLRVVGDPKMAVSLDDLSGAARVESSRQPGTGTSITIEQLRGQNAKASIDAGTLRHFIAALPPELHGRIEGGLANLSASGTMNLASPAKRDHFAGSIVFAGLRMRVTGDPKTTLRVDDLAGAAGIESKLPLIDETVITIKRLHAGHTDASIDTDAWRRFSSKLPTFAHGSMVAGFDALEVAGAIKSGRRNAVGFSGGLALHDFGMHASAGSQPEFTLDRMTAQANVELRLDRWEPATLKVRGGTTRWTEFSYGGRAVNNVETAWHAAGAMMTFDRFAAQIFGGEISGAPRVDLATHAIEGFDLQIKGIDAHQALANVAPAHLDADGVASGILHLALSAEGELSGHADLSFDAPGVLRIGQIAELQRMLAGNFGAEMANLAMHDLEHYPFKEGTLHLDSAGVNSELKIHFVRQPRTAADRTAPPRKEIINGREVWVGSLVVPKIDLTIPIGGKSFAEILAMVSGFHPLIESVGKQSGK
jgi:dicarboxylate transporter DctA-like protein